MGKLASHHRSSLAEEGGYSMACIWRRPAGRAQSAAGREHGICDLFCFWEGGGPGMAMRFLLHLTSAQTATYHVNPEGSGDCTTIPPALTAAISGDTVILHAGTYPGFDIGMNGMARMGVGSPRITRAVGLNNWNWFISCIFKKILTARGIGC